mgnify:CR=1 FL=1
MLRPKTQDTLFTLKKLCNIKKNVKILIKNYKQLTENILTPFAVYFRCLLYKKTQKNIVSLYLKAFTLLIKCN